MLFVSPVRLDLADQLRNDPEFRAEFFKLAADETIASQIRYLRELRDMRQVDLADATGMKQSAISRLEKADYASWNYNTLLRIAKALDARVKITFEPAEDVIRSLAGPPVNDLAGLLLGSGEPPPPPRPHSEPAHDNSNQYRIDAERQLA